jgi:hypothetical protein
MLTRSPTWHKAAAGLPAALAVQARHRAPAEIPAPSRRAGRTLQAAGSWRTTHQRAQRECTRLVELTQVTLGAWPTNVSGSCLPAEAASAAMHIMSCQDRPAAAGHETVGLLRRVRTLGPANTGQGPTDRIRAAGLQPLFRLQSGAADQRDIEPVVVGKHDPRVARAHSIDDGIIWHDGQMSCRPSSRPFPVGDGEASPRRDR